VKQGRFGAGDSFISAWTGSSEEWIGEGERLAHRWTSQ
jgi:hypothetical protein